VSTAEITPGWARPNRRPWIRAVVGALADGSPYYAPVGEVVVDGDFVLCHLCGDSFRSVLAHLRSHGWDQARYRSTFGLERGQPLEGASTRARRAAAFVRRRRREPAVRAGCAEGRRWVASGALAEAAGAAARGRRQPEQRRRKTLATLAAISPAARAAGARRHADDRLRADAAAAAGRLGHPDLGAFVRAGLASGESLAALSRAAGLHKDWLCRHLDRIDPAAAALARIRPAATEDARWLPVATAHGFADVAGYLTDRHLVRRHTAGAIAREAGLTRGAVLTALSRHGIAATAHATSRGRASDRATEVAARFGFPELDAYLADRRSAGLSWRAIAAECGQPPSWVRRRAGLS
jgi:hypothetical protein